MEIDSLFSFPFQCTKHNLKVTWYEIDFVVMLMICGKTKQFKHSIYMSFGIERNFFPSILMDKSNINYSLKISKIFTITKIRLFKD